MPAMMPLQERVWTKRYDPGVPATLAPYPTYPLFQMLRETAQKMPDTAATLTSAHIPVLGRIHAELSYKALDEQSDALACALSEMGVKKGDRVAIIMPNSAQYVIAFYAILKAGAIVCATNPTYPPLKLAQQLKDCGAVAVITLTMFYNAVKSIQKDTDVKQLIVSNIKDYFPSIAALLFTVAREKKEGHRVELQAGDYDFLSVIKRYAGRKPNVEVKPDDTAIFQYTGGTTGGLKAAMATHRALVANVLQCKSFLGSDQGEVKRLMAALPLFHVFGMVSVMMSAVEAGSTMLLVTNPRNTDEVLEMIDKYQPTYFHGVPAMYNAINNHAGVLAGKYNLGSISACISGSAPLPPITKRKFEEITGGKLVEGFGMSEMPTATHLNPLKGENKVGSIGVPFPDVETRIVSLDDGVTDLGPDEIGELVMRGPQMMRGYYNLPTETNNALREGPDGNLWFYSGDIARMDEDGYFYIVDRKKDMALIGGFNVYPTNVEKVLSEHPAVQESGVAAVPHPNPDKVGQEALKAWVILKPGQSVTEAELIEFCEKRLARYEVPTRIEFVPELPRSTVGKILRRELVQIEMAIREKQEKEKQEKESQQKQRTR